MSESSTETNVAPRQLPVVNAMPGPALQTMGEDVQLRTSNEVQGFQYSRVKAFVYTFSVFFKLPLLPLWPIFIAKEANDWSIARNYFKTLRYCFKVVVDQIRFGSFFRMVKYNTFMTPEQVEARIAQREGACSRCAKCCKQFDCIFLGQEDGGDYYCKVYRSDYWYYGTCGRYPLDQRDIDFHACPGFSFPDDTPAHKDTSHKEKKLPIAA